jgi:hypothetical protein
LSLFLWVTEHTIATISHESEIIQQAAAEIIRQRHQLSTLVYDLLRDLQLAEDVLPEVWIRLTLTYEARIPMEVIAQTLGQSFEAATKAH